MKVQYMSDLHAERSDNLDYFSKLPFPRTGDVLLVAGDIAYLSYPITPLKKFWEWADKNYKKVILIPGNHDYYGGTNLLEHGPAWRRDIGERTHYFSNRVVRVEDTDFILTTLWSDIDLSKAEMLQNNYNDFHRILCGRTFMTPEDYKEEFERCFEFIRQSVKESTAKHIVVVTHHLPSLKLLAPAHKGSPFVSTHASDLEDFIKKNPRIDYWIYGHSHTNIDMTIGRTRVVTNQLGFVQYNEHLSFDPGKFFTLD